MSRLEDALAAGRFVVTSELLTVNSGGLDAVHERLEPFEDYVDATNATDNTSAHAHASPLAVAIALKQLGMEPVMQLTCRDRNRLALEAEIAGAALHGIENILCLTGDDRALKKVRAGARFLQLQVSFRPERLAEFMVEAVAKGLAGECALLPSICLVRSPRSLRYIDEHVPGIEVPSALIERCERAADPEAECFEVACELAEHARSLPGVAGLHLISFRREAGIARLCRRLDVPTREARANDRAVAV
jgi:5,10-methylenetetrahydrofolate reductase